MANTLISEVQLISKMLETQDTTILTETGISVDYFDAYSKQFKFISDHYAQYKALPSKLTFLDAFNDFEFSDSSKESTAYLIKCLADGKTERALSAKFNRMRDYLMNGQLDKALELEHQMIESGDTNYLRNVPNILSQEEIDNRFEEYRLKAENLDDYFMPTGIPEFDKAFGGGWDRREELAAFVARPGVGKSWQLDNAVVAASRAGFRCGLFSGEMTKNKVAYRIDTFMSHISNSAISHGKRDVQTDYKRYLEELATQKDLGPIFIATIKDDFAGKTPTITDFGTFIEKYKLDVLFVDQLSLMTDIAHTRNYIDRMGNIAQELKLLQTIYHIPIITVCQQNRSGEKDDETGESKYDVSRIAGNDKIGQYCTIVIFLENDKDAGILKLIPAKVRDGGGKPEKYIWRIDEGVFEHMVDDQGFNAEEECEKTHEEFDGPEGPAHINW